MSLIPISSEPIRKKWLSYYHQIEKKLAKLKRDWNTFETEAQSTYQQWYHQTFAALISELSNIGEKVHELKIILSAIDAQREVNGLSKKSALDHVLNAIQNKQDPFPSQAETDAFRLKQKQAFEQDFKARHSPQSKEEIDLELLERARQMVMAQVRARYPFSPENPIEVMLLQRSIENAIHDTYEILKEGGEPSSDHHSTQSEEDFIFDDEGEEKNEEHIDQPSDYKDIYRKIVKRLHPDRGEEMSPEEKILWSDTQNAYRDKNAEALKTILLRLEGDGTIRIDQIDSIGEIIEITQSLHLEFEQINYFQRRIKKEWVYRFWASKKRQKNREKLALDIGGQLKQQIAYQQHQLRSLKHELDQLKKITEKKAKAGKGRK